MLDRKCEKNDKGKRQQEKRKDRERQCTSERKKDKKK